MFNPLLFSFQPARSTRIKGKCILRRKMKKKSHFLSHYFSIQSFDFREKQNCSLFITILHIFNLNIMKIYLFNFLSN